MAEFLTQQDYSLLFFQFFPRTGPLDHMRPFHHTQTDPLRPHSQHDRYVLSVGNSIFSVHLDAICGVHGTTIGKVL